MEEKKHKTGFGAQMMYGMAEFFNGGAFVIIGSFFTVFLIKAMGMPPALAGTVPLIGHVWDAITDPMMGNITDRTSAKMGPKRLYMLIGSFATAITFVMLWVPFSTKSTAAMFIFYVIMYCLFSTGSTILMVPYNGLLPDMIDDYALRSKFSNVRMIWSTLGSMVCGVVPTLLITDPTRASMYLKCCLIFGLCFLITCLITVAGTWENQHAPVKSRLVDSFNHAGSVFRNRTFRLFIGIYLTGQCGTDFVTGMAVYYVDDVINGYGNHYFTYLMAAIILSQLIGMLIWGPVMAKTSKRTTILIGAPIRIVSTLLLIPFSNEGASIIPILILACGIGIGNAATLTSIFAIMADMPDVDELVTGVHRPGVVSGMSTFARKISSGLSSWLIGVLLAAVGYSEKIANAGGRQALSTQHGIALVFILMPVILCVCLFIFGYRLPMTEKEFNVIKKEIARRRGEDNSVTTDEEKQICEKVTGLSYDRLWDPKNEWIGRRMSTRVVK
ncbi:MAG: MFS transporter [Lachnospiraceae bacterium]|nr:MFS transporter [Lachnospiraceae bacterium]